MMKTEHKEKLYSRKRGTPQCGDFPSTRLFFLVRKPSVQKMRLILSVFPILRTASVQLPLINDYVMIILLLRVQAV